MYGGGVAPLFGIVKSKMSLLGCENMNNKKLVERKREGEREGQRCTERGRERRRERGRE